MENATNLILAVPPAYIQQALQTQLTLAFMMYKIGRGYHLFCVRDSAPTVGGYMLLDMRGLTGGGPTSTLIDELLRECARKSFQGIILEVGSKLSPSQQALAAKLSTAVIDYKLELYAPEAVAQASQSAIILLPTALSGGTFEDYIGQTIRKYGANRVALALDCVRMDFSLPSVHGVGHALTAIDLTDLMRRHHKYSFFSKDLCTNYFLYPVKSGMHVVLYDDAFSIRKKLTVASALNIDKAILFYPHVAHIMSDILE